MAAEDHVALMVEEDLAFIVVDEIREALFPEDPLDLEQGLALPPPQALGEMGHSIAPPSLRQPSSVPLNRRHLALRGPISGSYSPPSAPPSMPRTLSAATSSPCSDGRGCQIYAGMTSGTPTPPSCSNVAHPTYVKKSLGHASVQLTLDRYSHWMPSMGKHTASAMDDALAEDEAADEASG